MDNENSIDMEILPSQISNIEPTIKGIEDVSDTINLDTSRQNEKIFNSNSPLSNTIAKSNYDLTNNGLEDEIVNLNTIDNEKILNASSPLSNTIAKEEQSNYDLTNKGLEDVSEIVNLSTIDNEKILNVSSPLSNTIAKEEQSDYDLTNKGLEDITDITNLDTVSNDKILNVSSPLSNTIAKEEKSPNKRKKNKQKNKLSNLLWFDFIESPTVDIVRKQLSIHERALDKIIVKVKSVICSAIPKEKNSIALFKLSILPLPAKITTLRSVQSSGSLNNTHISDSVYEFGSKSALLSMSMGDARSNCFKKGECPRIHLIFMIQGSSNYIATASLYLPSILVANPGDMLCIPMKSINEDGETVNTTAIIEIGDTTKINAFGNILNNDIKEQAKVNLTINGLVNFDEIASYKDQLLCSVSFLANGYRSEINRGRYIPQKSSFDLSSSITFSPLLPKYDIIEVAIRKGPLPDDDLGKCWIPIEVLSNSDSMLNKPLHHSMWKYDTVSMTETICSWGCIVTIDSIDLLQVKNDNDNINKEDVFDKEEPLVSAWMDPTPQQPKTSIEPIPNFKSSQGHLIVACKGFFSHVQKNEKPWMNSKSSYFVEVLLMPEGVRKRTEASFAISESKSESINGYIAWDKMLKFGLTWALQQRKVSSIKINLCTEAGNTRNALVKIIGSFSVDLASIAQSPDSNLMCLMPISSSPTEIKRIHKEEANLLTGISGWIFVSFKFVEGYQNLDIDSIVVESGKVINSEWNRLSDMPSIANLGLTTSTNFNNIISSSVHIALSNLQLSKETLELLFKNRPINGKINVALAIISDCDNYSIATAQISTNGAVVWNCSDFILKLCSDQCISSLIDLQLIMESDDHSYESMSSTVVGSSSVIIDQQKLLKGIPVNFSSPLRNMSGDRIALVYLSAQGSSIDTNNQSNTTASNSHDDCIEIEFLDGNICDTTSVHHKVEPFFECSLTNGKSENIICRSRTAFFREDDKLKQWNLSTKLMLPQGLGDPKSSYSIIVLCRDAARQNCPEISWFRISIPLQSIMKGKSIDKWVKLVPVTSDIIMNDGASRVKVRFTYRSTVLPPNDGIGSVFVRLDGIINGRSMDNELENILMAEASVSIPSSTNEYKSSPEQLDDLHLFSQSSCGQSNFPPYINAIESLCCMIPVPGGLSDITIDLASLDNNKFRTTFPVVSTLPQRSNTKLTHFKSSTTDLNLINAKSSSTKTSNKVRVEAIFVPHVEGNLLITCEEFTWYDAGLVRKAENGDMNIGLRYVVGTDNKSVFEYSNVLQLKRKLQLLQTAHPSKKKSKELFSPSISMASSNANMKSPSPNKARRNKTLENQMISSVPTEITNTYIIADNVQQLHINTADIISSLSQSSIIPLFIDCFEIDSVFENSPNFLLGVGMIDTTKLYFESIRAAASSSLSDVENKLKNDIGSSKIYSTDSDLYDKLSGQKVATIKMKVKFIADSIPKFVLQNISNSLALNNYAIPTELSRFELGLKQTFIAADKDSSGSVSASELLAILTDASTTHKKKSKPTLIGLENSVELLFKLAGISSDANINQTDVQNIVCNLFRELDVDGDGTISWWEWKTVLTATLLGKNPDCVHYDPMDVLVVSVSAASSALVTLRQLFPNFDFNDKSKKLKFIDNNEYVNQDNAGAIIDEVGVKFPSSELNLSSEENMETSSGTVGRLHSMVKSLRMTNNILARRFEKALKAAQVLSIDVDRLIPSSSDQNISHVLNRSDAEIIEKRIQEAEKESEFNHSSLLAIRHTVDDLSLKLTEAKFGASQNNSIDVTNPEENRELKSLNKLKNELKQHNDKLREIRELKSKQLSSLLLLQKFMKNKAIPYVKAKKFNKRASQICLFLMRCITKMKVFKLKLKRNNSCTSIQRVMRGKLTRNLLEKQDQSVRLIQKNLKTININKINATFKKKYRNLKRMIKLLSNHIYITTKICFEKLKTETIHSKNSEVILFKTKQLQLLSHHFYLWNASCNVKKNQRIEIIKSLASEMTSKTINEANENMTQILLDQQLQKLQSLENEKKKALELENHQQLKSRIHEAETYRQMKNKLFDVFRFVAKIQMSQKPDISDVISNCWIREPFHNNNDNNNNDYYESLGKVESVDITNRLMMVKYLHENGGLEGKFATKLVSFDHPLLQWYAVDNNIIVNIPDDVKNKAALILQHTILHRKNNIKQQKKSELLLKNNSASIIQSRYLRYSTHRKYINFNQRQNAAKVIQNAMRNKLAWNHNKMREKEANDAIIKQEMLKAENQKSKIEKFQRNRAAKFIQRRFRHQIKIIKVKKLIQNKLLKYYYYHMKNHHKKLLNKRTNAQSKVYNFLRGIISMRKSRAIINKRKQETALAAFHKSSVPDIKFCMYDYYILYSKDGTELYPNYGKVMDVNLETRIMSVIFMENIHDSKYRGPITYISFDHPYIIWYYKSPDVMTIIPSPRNIQAMVKRNRPNTINEAIGYQVWIDSHEPDAKEGDVMVGWVDKVNPYKQTVLVAFETSDGTTQFEKEEYPFNSDDIDWVIPPLPNRPVSIYYSVGFYVEMKSHEVDAQPGDVYLGKIVGFNADDNTIRISFNTEHHDNYFNNIYNNNIENDENDEESLNFFSSDLSWLPLITQKPLKSAVSVPNKIIDSIGYDVEAIHWNRICRGKVFSVNQKSNKIKVLFANNSNNDNKISFECEEYDFDSPMVGWMNPSAYILSAVQRPLAAKDAIGYEVEVRSNEHDAKPGDMFAGRVVGFHRNKNNQEVISIDFDTNQNSTDVEKILFLSPNIGWMKKPEKKDNNSNNSDKKSLEYVVSTVPRPMTAKDAIGYEVEVKSNESDAKPGDMMAGKIVDYHTNENNEEMLSIDFSYLDDTYGPDIETYLFLSPHIGWMKKPDIKAMNNDNNNVNIDNKKENKDISDKIPPILIIADSKENEKYIIPDSKEMQGPVAEEKNPIPTLSHVPSIEHKSDSIDCGKERKVMKNNSIDLNEHKPIKVESASAPPKPAIVNNNDSIKINELSTKNINLSNNNTNDNNNNVLQNNNSINSFVTVPPANIKEAVNYIVDVYNNDPSQVKNDPDDDNDIHEGKVISINEKSNMVKVSFSDDHVNNNDNKFDDFEDIDFLSKRIIWIRKETNDSPAVNDNNINNNDNNNINNNDNNNDNNINNNDNNNIISKNNNNNEIIETFINNNDNNNSNKSINYNNINNNVSSDPPAFEDSIGWIIKLHVDDDNYVMLKVISIDMITQKMIVKAISLFDGKLDDDEDYIDYHHLGIQWIQKE
eukprot:gene4899-6860_t